MDYWSREEEDETIIAASSGDEMAFETLFKKYLPLINKWFRDLNFKGRMMDRDDWHQECRMVLMTTLKRYQGRSVGEFAAYYRLNVRNRGFDLRRRQNAQKRIQEEISKPFEGPERDSLLGSLASFQPDGLNLVEMHEQIVGLYTQLSAFEQQVWWGLNDGLSIEHIALQYQCSYSKVRNAANRCRGKAVTVLLTNSNN
ncbi:MAG TPA: hypothetical protein DCW31_01710 [Lactobacillus sp.]|nr:hypothetical protein [Lactobacillus sp.]